MKSSLIIVARIQAKEDRVEFLRSELQKLVEPTLTEKGCIQYDLHQDNNDPSVFLFFEIWENRELWQAHMESEHLKAYMAATDGAVADFTLNEMSQV